MKQIAANYDIGAHTGTTLHDVILFEKIQNEMKKWDCYRSLKEAAENKSIPFFMDLWENKSITGYDEEFDELEAMYFSDSDYLSYTLHPKFKGSKLRKIKKEMVFNSILKYLSSKKAIVEYRSFMDFIERKGKFADVTCYEFDAGTFWLHFQNVSGNLSKLGLKYSTLPCITTKILSFNSRHSFLHNMSRHSLSQNQLEKALFAFNTLKTLYD